MTYEVPSNPNCSMILYVPEEDASGIHMLAGRAKHEATAKELLPQYVLKDVIMLQCGR